VRKRDGFKTLRRELKKGFCKQGMREEISVLTPVTVKNDDSSTLHKIIYQKFPVLLKNIMIC
jgi:hypothetical protein